ncbi:MAG: hypothetical protein WA941_14125 [Nitrososphaeraceae archaeon]
MHRYALVIENDDHLYYLKDCIEFSRRINIPIVLDSFHHQLLSNDESLRLALRPATLTWNQNRDGLPIVDYSSPHVGYDEKTSREERAIMLKALMGLHLRNS